MDSGRRETDFPSHLEAYAVVAPSVFLRRAAPAAIILIAENGICGAERGSAGAYTSPPLIRESY
jgi:hypothetical protein